MKDSIKIKGARVNNLKNIDVEIPRNKLVVVTGVSGSGKSSLAFDTLYAEGQRRYIESLSTYARQFLGRLNKPDCDFIEGIPPAIAIEQKVIARNPRSTVGTSTEIYDYLRMLFARVGHTLSPVSGREVKKHDVEDIVQCMLSHEEGTRLMLLAPIHVPEGRSRKVQVDVYQREGYALTDDGNYIIIDRIVARHEQSTIDRLTDSAKTALYEGHGECVLHDVKNNVRHSFSTRFEADGIVFEEPSDQLFSFNSPAGACPECEGFGRVIGIDENLVIPNQELSVMDGAVVCWRGEKMSEWKKAFVRRASHYDFPIFTPYYDLTQAQKDFLWHGDPTLDPQENVCIDAFFEMLRQNQYKIQYRVMLAHYRGKTTCPVCHGSRLRKEANYVKVGGRSITELVEMPILRLQTWFQELQLSDHDAEIAKRLLTEISNRLQFLCDVGLGYLTLNRLSNTLSGGESQRINLATSLGSSLVGSLYILDEPSIGLHSRDTQRLIHVLKELQALGNTVVVVEHDQEMMEAADYIIDIGPDAGRLGGKIVWQGALSTINDAASTDEKTISHTLDYLTGREQIIVPASRRPWNNYIEIRGARENNLKGLDVKFPLNVMTVVTGVSGSGKSTLVRNILYRGLKRHFDEVTDRPGQFTALDGDLDMIKKVDFVDQNPIGTSTRSNPVTYIGAYDEIRKLMAQQQLSKQMNYTPAYFSFNQEGGRCEECKGEGTVTIEMQFMNDIVLECEACHGKRFKDEILAVKFEGQNIDDMLNMTINQAVEFFTEHGQKKIVQKMKPLQDVGLGYLKLGQSSSTLSGGENQRVKLAYYLSQEKTHPTLFIFDEPTTGLHFHDIKRLLAAFDALISRGHTVLIIEHNMDVIKCADHVIDLGPEGGEEGGNIVVTGTPEEVAQCTTSYTGQYLAAKLQEDAQHSNIQNP
ncbi:MAG: excinuclease ABC subunit UvrA [Prevotellaceae bacterium]|nr:excinuclease ABC subunit UvrA [Prevotellaceae bacterium]